MKKKGISLIVLIITIIVIIILAGTVILNLTNNNPIDSARKAKFLNDVDTFKSELSLYELGKITNTDGNFNPKSLNADKNSVTENGIIDQSRGITDVITSMENTNYEDKLEIIAGELVYVGDSEKESNWLDGVIESKDFKINLSLVPDMNNIVGKITLSGLLVDETKIEYYRIYLSQTKDSYSDTPNVEIVDKLKEVEFNLENLIPNSDYYIKVELKMKNEPEVRVKESGKIVTKPDNIVPNAPQIVIPGYSNKYEVSPVSITLTDDEGGSGISKGNSKYIIDQISTNYTEDNDIWQAGSSNFNIDNFIGDTATLTLNVESDGEYYVHVLAVDNAGNKKASVSGKIIVDTTVPNEAGIVVPQTATNNSIEATVTMSDNANGSGLDLSKCKYIYSAISYPYGDTESIWDTGTIFTSETQTITVTSSTNEIYYLHVLIVDKAGNRKEVLSSGVTTNTETPLAPLITATAGSNVWTNQNVEVTVNEVTSPGIEKYEYTINGGSWQEYTGKISITSEGVTTIKARATNNVGTVGAESSGYIVNIDKTNPTLIFGTNGASYVKVAGSTATISDAGGSGINSGSLQYIWSTSTTEPTSGWTTFSNGSALTKTGVTGTYYLWIKGSDNAGNTVITKSNAFTIDNTAPTLTFSPNSSGLTANNIRVDVNVSDVGGSNIKYWRYRISSDNGATYGAWGGVDTGYDPSQTYTLAEGVNTPVKQGSYMYLLQDQEYMLEFDYRSDGTNSLFNVDLWPDDLPETWPTANTTLQHYTWNNIKSSSSNINNCRLRFFNNRAVPNPSNIYISNINLYPKGNHSIDLTASGNWKIQVEIYDNAGNGQTYTSGTYQIDKTPPPVTFNYTGSSQTWTAQYTGKIKIETWGAKGATIYTDDYAGKGGYATGELNVTAGDILYVYVGGHGLTGGWNGGGINTYQSSTNRMTYGGGGASDVRKGGTALSNRIIVAGGGGAGGAWNAKGGDGGGLVGNSGTATSPYSGNRFGTGGTQSGGGIGGTTSSSTYTNGGNGTLGVGGNSSAASGAGGGGYYGGGGATGINADDGGGGGGSSYIGGVSNGNTITGANTENNGKVIISYFPM